MAHANARLTPAGRLTLVGRIAANRAGRSLTSPTRWASLAHRRPLVGPRPAAGRGRPGRSAQHPLRSPRRTAARLEERILRLRRRERLGPARIAARLVAGLDRASGAGPPSAEPAGLAGPADRPADPPR
jgi:hypothetical protein